MYDAERKPRTIVFPSYTASNCKDIIHQRCDLCNEHLHTKMALFQPGAIELCSKKVVRFGCRGEWKAETGDARRLLDICKSALQTTFSDGVVSADKSVTLPEMSKTLFRFFRSGESSRISMLPRLVQILLACLCGMAKEMEMRSTNPKYKNQPKTITTASLRSVYLQVQKNMTGGVRPNANDFGTLVDQLVHNGFCKVVSSRRLKPVDRPVCDVLCLERSS